MLTVSFTGWNNAPIEPNCIAWLFGVPGANVGSGTTYSETQWNRDGTGVIKLLYWIRQNQFLSPAAYMAGFTFYSSNDGGLNACELGSSAKHAEATDWLLAQVPGPDDLVAIIGHSYGGERARRFVEDIKLGTDLHVNTDLLVAIDPVDWTSCNVSNDYNSAQTFCDQGAIERTHVARTAMSYQQKQGLQLPLFPDLRLLGYKLSDSNAASRPGFHITVDDDATIKDRILATLTEMVKATLPSRQGCLLEMPKMS